VSFWRLYYHVIWATKGREPWLCGEVDRRIRSIRVPRKGRYLKRIIRAHAAHHQKSTRHKGVSFGFLWAPATTPTPDALGSTERALAGSTLSCILPLAGGGCGTGHSARRPS
jgi:hypothetical protein